MTIRTRLTLWYGAVLASTVAVLGVFVWLSAAAILHASVDEALEVQAADVRSGLDRDLHVSVTRLDPGQPGLFTAVFGPGAVLQQHGQGFPNGITLPASGATTERPSPAGPAYAVLAEAGPGGHTILVGSSLAGVDRSLDRLAFVLIGCGLVGCVASLAGGWLLSGRALHQVERLTREAADIGAADLDRRLPEPTRQDEVGRLARTLNGMLDRVAAAVRRERAFVAAASHDLRTPIAALRTELELAVIGSDDAAALKRAIGVAHADAVRLSTLAADLLRLAESEAAGRSVLLQQVDLHELIDGAISVLRPVAALRATAINVTAPYVVVDVDRVRLEQTLVNLLGNAIREAPPGSDVDLVARVATDPSSESSAAGAGVAATLEVEVLDRGPGVDPDVRPVLFVPFAARARGRADGSGLGLATAAAAVKAHGGEIRYADRRGGGAVFTVRLPTRAWRLGAPGSRRGAVPSIEQVARPGQGNTDQHDHEDHAVERVAGGQEQPQERRADQRAGDEGRGIQLHQPVANDLDDEDADDQQEHADEVERGIVVGSVR